MLLDKTIEILENNDVRVYDRTRRKENRSMIVILPYKKKKIKLLKQFAIFLNIEQKKHLYSLTTEISVDRYCRRLFSENL